MNRKNGLLASVLVLLCIISGILFTQFRPTATDGTKTIAVVVNHLDGRQVHFSYETQAEYLGELLRDVSLISGEEGPFGLFITTVDGETADENRQQWWSIAENGETVTVGIDELPVTDGNAYELTLTEGY